MVLRPRPLRPPRRVPSLRRFQHRGDVQEDFPARLPVPGVDHETGPVRDPPVARPEPGDPYERGGSVWELMVQEIAEGGS